MAFILKEELAGQLSLSIWLEQVDAHLEGHAISWAGRLTKVTRILTGKNLGTAIVKNKNTFITNV